MPRCVLADLEPSHINAIREGSLGKLFNPEYMVTGSTGAGNNWAKGFYTEGAVHMESVLDIVKKQVECCDCLQGFQLLHSIGGGTGSGMGSLLLRHLRDDYQDRIVNTFSIIPSEKVSETVVEPYNAVLTLAELATCTDETVCFDNEALFDICINYLKIKTPTIYDLNHMVTMAIAGVTTCFRFPGQLNSDLRKLMTNMCPFPRLHFFIPGYAPLKTLTNEKQYCKITVDSLAKELFNPCMHMAGNGECGKYLTCAAIFRGYLSSKEVEKAMVKVKEANLSCFTKWIPNSIKSAICDVPPRSITASATFLANTCSITSIFKRLLCQFDAMFQKRAFVHWYTGEGMDEQEFRDAMEIVTDICDEYEKVCNDEGESDDEFSEESCFESDDETHCDGCC
jgi:tubulin beta